MSTWKRSTVAGVAAAVIPPALRRWFIARSGRSGSASGRPARKRMVADQHRATRRYQALLDLPVPAGGGAPERMPWPTWRAVVRARHYQTKGGGLFSALVTGLEGPASPDDSLVIVTMVVVGDSPAEYLGIGDEFTLWRGGDVAHGVITRRLFV